MNNFRISFCCAVLISLIAACSQPKPQNPSFEALSNIAGTWEMRFDSAAVVEQWEKINDTLYRGKSFEVSGTDSVLSETVELTLIGDDIFYSPAVVNQNNGKAVAFKLTLHEGGKFVFENPGHDFPTAITYEFLPENKLKASISGEIKGEIRSLDFDYEKIK